MYQYFQRNYKWKKKVLGRLSWHCFVNLGKPVSNSAAELISLPLQVLSELLQGPTTNPAYICCGSLVTCIIYLEFLPLETNRCLGPNHILIQSMVYHMLYRMLYQILSKQTTSKSFVDLLYYINNSVTNFLPIIAGSW